MASVQRVHLFPEEALTASEVGSSKVLEPHTTDFVAWLAVSANDGSTTVDVDIEHSADNTNFVTVDSFTTVTNATGYQELQITKSLLPYVRANITLGGTPDATVEVSLYQAIRR